MSRRTASRGSAGPAGEAASRRLVALWLGIAVAALPALPALPGAAEAPAAFAARLVLPDGRPAGGFTVTVVGRPETALCDPDGRFVLSPAPATPFSIVAGDGGGRIWAPVAIEALPESVSDVILPEVHRDSLTVVSGVAPSLDRLPGGAATVLTREALDQRPPQRLYQVLESVAGASKLGDGADSVPALRGLARGRTLILLDGARITAERRAGPSATFVEPASLAAVEVVRGPGSVTYGSDAFGGVINAISRDPDAGRFSLRFDLEASAGALDQQSAHASASTAVASGLLLLEAHGRDAGDAETGGGESIFNSSFEGAGGGIRYVRDAGPGRLRVGLAVDRVEDLGKASIDSRQIRAFYPDETSRRLTLSWTGVPGGGWDSLETSLFAGSYHIVLDRDRAPTATSNRRIDRSDTDADDVSLRTVGARALGGGMLQVGFDASSRFGLHAITGRTDFAADAATVTGVQESVSVDDAQQVAGGLFATWNRSLARWLSAVAGVRADRIESANSGGFFGDRSDSYTPLSGNLSLTAAPSPSWTTTVQLARGFRTPSLSDRYFRGPSGRGFVTGNPELDPESSLQLDLSARYVRGRTGIGVFAYRYEIENLVERYAQGSDFFFRNRGEAMIEGLEVEAQTAVGERWSGELGLAWAQGDASGAGGPAGPVDDIAPPNGWLTLRRSLARGYVLARITAFGEHDDPGPTEVPRAGYALLDVAGGVPLGHRLELRLTARNLADKRYFASPDEAADRAVGRSYTVGLSGRF